MLQFGCFTAKPTIYCSLNSSLHSAVNKFLCFTCKHAPEECYISFF